MSGWFGSWFGGNSGAKTAAATKEAIVRLRTQIDMLHKRETHMEKQIEEQDQIARKNVTSNVKAAKAALKRKKVLEKNLESTQAHIATLEAQMNAVENANINIETVKTIQQVNVSMAAIQAQLGGANAVEKVMDKMEENTEYVNDISESIKRANLGQQIDEDDLEEELNQMAQEELDNKMLGAPAAPVTAAPGAVKPVAVPKQTVEDEEEEELRKLQAEMAM
ncbi:Snf7-domain-containing protein [Ascodesmis nigricans]|uniref:Vacuolar-sorting protein SNF7 n=1 Tax=Ascodesmis nigricans TaxID=341454 RepID=A0A4S2N5F3_9PEZI|nr:Snf7-domain-containing protein [Ascodesmis nigricans]